ncbi:hypothetical protein BJ138DRAFT_1011466 [Hygrophoropsis aurantiaca]|uniref:Uncharacterized protein n=1 Tax=Hygrophoropsis aurantiaca TaxID=72124 RepID=A0ACB8A7P3_9AGAM|nr:hypothetical protein BJ138DRAFT_1011466 [Hygrophoropsis aurantiaca]
MNALSRREEDTLLKATKARALRECDSVVKDFAECATGRTISVAWACRHRYKELQECMLQLWDSLPFLLIAKLTAIPL